MHVIARSLAIPLATLATVLFATAPPLLALLRTSDGFDVAAALDAHGDALVYGLALAAGAAAASFLLAALGTLARPRGPLLLSLAAFLLGGQFLALGMIRAFNPPPAAPQLWRGFTGALYDRPPYHAAAGLALFAWLPLAAALVTWTGGRWRAMRGLAAADGANALQTAAYIVWPLAWPGLLAASLAVLGLTLTESAAAALLVPGTPINFMLSNLHTLNYPAMAEAALLMTLVCAGGTAVAVAAWRAAATVRRRATGARRTSRAVVLVFLAPPAAFLLASCERPPQPEAVWAESGTGPGQLAYPRAVAYSPADDTVWVVDKSARVQQFDSDGHFIRGWDMPASAYGKPVGLTADRDGNLWVADSHYHRVIVYRPDGAEWFRFGEKGEGPGQFVWPTDVALTDDGRVFVAEYGSGGADSPNNDRVQVFRRHPDGTITDPPAQRLGQIGRFGSALGAFRRPQSLVLVGDKLWVADGVNHRLQAFALDGTLLKTLGGDPGDAPGRFRFPYGLDVDADGKLLVSEFGNHRIQRIDPDTGACLGTWGGTFGARPGQLKYPWGLAYDAGRERVIVIDSGNDRFQVVPADDILLPRPGGGDRDGAP